MCDLATIAGRFAPRNSIAEIREFGSGNINTTYLVTLGPRAERHFILQRLNTKVFRNPELVMQNVSICTEHILRCLQVTPSVISRRWEVPKVLPSRDGRDYLREPDGSFWRAISFIEGTRSFKTIKDIAHAREVGYALGLFHTLINDLPSEKLADTLEGFHITPVYLRHYDEVLATYRGTISAETNYCRHFIERRRDWTAVLENAKAQGKLHIRPIHGDPKIDNILMDDVTMQAVSVVDLDTVKPGLVHYDIGDCLRSGCNLLGEDGQPDAVRFETDICRAILQGYLSGAGGFLTGNDFHFLYDSIRLIAFELGLRFFTDYLEGNVYFRAGSKEQNLTRALVQFRLTESIEAHETTIRTIIRDALFMKKGSSP